MNTDFLNSTYFYGGSIIIGLLFIFIMYQIIKRGSSNFVTKLITSTSSLALNELKSYVDKNKIGGANSDFLSTALVIVEKAVKASEQMYKEDQAVDRKTAALVFIHDAFLELGIELTEEKSKIIERLILSFVNDLPKTVVKKTTTKRKTTTVKATPTKIKE